MRIEGLSQPVQPNPSGSRTEATRQKKAAARPGDVVEISRRTPDAAALASQAKAAADPVNPRIGQVQARVQSGYYSSPDGRRRVADALLQSDSLRGVVSDIVQAKAAKQQLAQVPEVRQQQVDQARQRVQTRFYDTAEVRRATAQRMLDEMA